MESLIRKRIFIAVLSIAILIGVVYYARKKKEDSTSRELDKSSVPREVMDQIIKTHDQELAKAESFEGEGGTNFPLVLGSEGENVTRLQRALGIKETGTLDEKTMKAFQAVLRDVGLNDLSKVSEASVILLEAYANNKNIKDFIEGDIIVSNDPKMVVERMNVRRNPKGDIIQLQPTKDYKVFGSGDKIGILAKKISDDQGLVKSDLGDFLLVKLSSVKKK